MKNLTLPLLFLILVLLLLDYLHIVDGVFSDPPREAPPVESRQEPSREEFAPPSRPQPATPSELLEQERSFYRLVPDRRLLLAAETARHLLKGESTEMDFKYADEGHWRLTGAASAPELNAIPSFVGMKNFLSGYIAALAEPATVAEGVETTSGFVERAGSMDPGKLMAFLTELNTVSKSHPGREEVVSAARVMVRLAFTVYDRVETADEVQARALALLTMAQVMSGRELVLEESLLAYAMGYYSHARALLPQIDDHAWRAFLERDDLVLAREARDAAADSLAKYLWLLRLAQNNRYSAWWRVLVADFDSVRRIFYALATGRYLSDFSSRAFILDAMPYLVFGQVMADIDSKAEDAFSERNEAAGDSLLQDLVSLIRTRFGTTSKELMEMFEHRLSEASGTFTGPYLDGSTYQAYYRGYFFSAFYQLGLHYLNKRSSLKEAEQFLEKLGSSRQRDARHFRIWFNNLVAARSGNADMDAMLADLRQLTSFGLQPLYLTLEDLLPAYGFGKPERQQAAEFLLARMDSRISHRYKYAKVMRDHLLHLSPAEQVYNSIIRDSPKSNRTLAAWLARYYDDPGGILSVAEDEEASAYVRTYSAGLLSRYPGYEETALNILRKTREEYPDEWEVFESLLEVNERLGRHGNNLQLADAWLSRDMRSRNPFHDWKARLAKAAAQEALGDPELAWRTVKSVSNSQYGPGMRRAVDLLLTLGRYGEAEDVAERMMLRYPNSVEGFGKRLRVFWEKEEFEAAAKYLAGWNYSATAEDWRYTVGREMVAALKGDRGNAARAAEALNSAGAKDWILRELAVMAGREEAYDLAYEIQSRLRFAGPGQLSYDIEAYRYLKELAGQAAAVDWLSGRIPAGRRNFSSMILYGAGEIDLLWRMIPEPHKESHDYAVWLVRAAAYVEGYPLSESRRAVMYDYYEAAGNNHYQMLGKMLLDMVDKEILLNRSMDRKQLNETSYYLGIKALGEGRPYDAADWFRACISTKQFKSGEYRWAYDYLYRLKQKSRSLAVLAEHQELIRELR